MNFRKFLFLLMLVSLFSFSQNSKKINNCLAFGSVVAEPDKITYMTLPQLKSAQILLYAACAWSGTKIEYEVTGFTCVISVNGISKTFECAGSLLSDKASQILKSATTTVSVSFKNISVRKKGEEKSKSITYKYIFALKT